MFRKQSTALCALACALVVALGAPARANDSIGYLVDGDNHGTRRTLLSIREQKFQGIQSQHDDFSCGAAVLATLFRDGYDAPVTETDVLKGMLNVADPAVVRARGFSLLDIKNYAKVVGLGAEGYALPIGSLHDLRVPAIVLLDVRGYHHFAILRRVDATWAYLADPALGYRTVALDDFAKEYSGVVLVLLGKGYKTNNILAQTHPPLGPGSLLESAPGPNALSEFGAVQFIGVPPVQRL
jgi:predicted double-glycine peptidase